MNTKAAFAIGPLASPLFVLLLVILVSLVSGLQDGFIGLIKAASILFLVSLAYSYIFTFVFGLPIYIYFIKKSWVTWLHFNAGAIISVSLLGIVMVILKQEEYANMYILPITLFAILNANLMWYIYNKTANKAFKRDAEKASRPLT